MPAGFGRHSFQVILDAPTILSGEALERSEDSLRFPGEQLGPETGWIGGFQVGVHASDCSAPLEDPPVC